jgi:hypothetical protein
MYLFLTGKINLIFFLCSVHGLPCGSRGPHGHQRSLLCPV